MEICDKKMKINDGIKELWKGRFFEKPRLAKEVESELFKSFGLTSSNIHASLRFCSSFLRKRKEGWIQKNRHSFKKGVLKEREITFDKLKIHPEIRKVSYRLFQDGYYAQAIFEAFKKVNNIVKSKSELQEDGKGLMMKVFNEKNPILKFNKLKSVTDINIQEGRKFLFAGAILSIRNPKAHEEVIQTDPIRTMKYLSFASLLIEFLGELQK